MQRTSGRGRILGLGAGIAAALVGIFAGPAQAAVVYSNDFSGGAGPAFSNPKISNADRDGTLDPFSGNFNNETQTLTLTNLPAHTSVTVEYDVYVLDSWDGNCGGDIGPDRYTDAIGNGSTQATQLDTTFANNAGCPQSYPAQYLAADNPAYSGAEESGTIDNFNFYGSSVYRISHTVSHSDSTLVVTFTGSNLQPIHDESWGIDNVVVSTSGTPTSPEGPAGDPSCSDTVDNDNDGQTDAADSGCAPPPSGTDLCFGQPATITGNGTVTGTNGDDVIITGNGNDTVDGLGGNDRICTRGGDDYVRGGTGNDQINSGNGNDNTGGQAGNDLVQSTGGDDDVQGGAGDDRVQGGEGNDTLNGGDGVDRVEGEGGNDLVAGNAGSPDTCDGGPGTDATTANGGCEVIVGIP